MIIKKNGTVGEIEVLEEKPKKSCTFERIYFSRGNDRDIYQERKHLGKELAEAIIEEIEGDLTHTVFTYIPNTSQTAFIGLSEAIDDYLNVQKKRRYAVSKILKI